MNIYKLSQTQNTGYDTYSNCVVVAEKLEDAKTIHPNGSQFKPYSRKYEWADTLDGISVELIGTATEGRRRGVVCASFHAG